MDIENLMTLASEKMMEEDFEGANELIDAAIAIEPDNPRAMQAKGVYYLGTSNNYSLALAYFNKALQGEEENESLTFNIGYAYFFNEEYTKALPYLLKSLSAHEEEIGIQMLVLSCYYFFGDSKGIEDHIDNIIVQEPPNLFSYYVTTRASKMLRKNYQCDFSPNEYLAQDPSAIESLRMIARALHINKQWAEALFFHQKILDIDPLNEAATADKICCLRLLGEYDKAIEVAQHLLSIEKNHSYAEVELMNTLIAANYFSEAERQLTKFLEKDPENYQHLKDLGYVLDNLNRPDEAAKVFRKCIAMNETDYYPVMMLGYLSYKQDDYLTSEKYLRAALLLNPADYESTFYLAHILETQNRFNEALFLLKQCDEIRPNQKTVLRRLGLISMNLGDRQAAISYHEKVFIDATNEDVEICLYLSQLYEDIGLLEDAMRVLLRGTDQFPTNDIICCHIGLLWRTAGDHEAANIWFQKAVDLNPRSDMGNSLLGEYYVDREPQLARTYLNRALSCNENSGWALGGLGALAIVEDQPKKAYQYLTAAVAAKPALVSAYQMLCNLSAEINPDRDEHFYKYLYFNHYDAFSHTPFILRYAIEMNAPMLVDRIVIGADYNYSSLLVSHAGSIESAKSKVKFFKRLINTWRAQHWETEHSKLAEAIIRYHLGDHIAALKIFEQEISDMFLAPSTLACYYYSLLVRYSICDLELLYQKLEGYVRNMLENPLPEDTYYAALFYQANGKLQPAIKLLKDLASYYRPAQYLLASFYQKFAASEFHSENAFLTRSSYQQFLQEYTVMNAEIAMMEEVQPLYKFGMKGVVVSEDPEQFVKDVVPVLQFIEIRDYVTRLFAQSIELDAPFYQLIRLDESEELKKDYSLEAILPVSWKKLMRTDLDYELLEKKANAYEAYGEYAAHELAGDVLRGTKAEKSDIDDKITAPLPFDFRMYMGVACTLYSRKIFNFEQTMDLINYISYCLKQIPDVKNNAIAKFIVDSVIELLMDSVNVPYIYWLQKLSALNEVLKERTRVKKASILTYSEYLQLMSENDGT